MKKLKTQAFKKQIIILCIALFHTVNAQSDKEISIFHRLLVFNSEGQMLVVKIANTDFWVTPGLYQTKEQTIKTGLDSIASTFGIALKELKLNGTFILKREINGERATSLRNVYTAKAKDYNEIIPNGIEQIKWLSTDQAMKTINFPHMNSMINQIVRHPDKVWGGTLLQFKEKDQWKTKIVEEFYPLFAK